MAKAKKKPSGLKSVDPIWNAIIEGAEGIVASEPALTSFVMGTVLNHGLGELSDAAAALDWLQSLNRESKGCWIAGFSFGAWIGMQLLMRRPEVEGFISVAPQENLYDFSFLAPCPSSGLIIHGEEDRVSPPSSVQKLVDKLMTQKGITIEQQIVPGANHFFENHVDELIERCGEYLDRRREDIANGGGR
jgi:alpha/beta superfamily hydrolase